MIKKPRRPAWGKLILAALVVGAISAAWRYTSLSDLITYDRIIALARVVRETTWAPAAVILAFTPAAFLMFPRPLLTLFAVIAFGPWLGLTYSVAGVIGATLVTYGTGRVVRYDTVRRFAGDKVDRLTKALRAHGLLAVIAANMIPIPPFGVQGIIAGAVRVKVWDYLFGCVLSMVPGMLAATIFGKEIGTGLEDPGKISYWLLGVGIVLSIGLAYLFRRWTREVWH